MHELQNVLYVMTQGALVRLEADALRIHVEGELVARFPLLSLAGIVVFGQVSVTPAMIRRCSEDGRSLVWLTWRGRFVGRLQGPVHGNVLLRRAQHEAVSDPVRTLAIARQFVAGKLRNSRSIVLRGARDSDGERPRADLKQVEQDLAVLLGSIPGVRNLDELRGLEGAAARRHFEGVRAMVSPTATIPPPQGRTRRPPRDQFNALLSFLYTLMRSECDSALQGVGLDPQVGFLHALRPGRPALALDLQESLRAVADRLALTLVNRRQLGIDDFEEAPGGGVWLSDSGRRTVLVAYQKRKEVEVQHRALKRKVPLGLVPHVQARLLARHLRGDLDFYPPFLLR